MDLFYDERDDPYHEARGSQILYWLDDLGAKPFTEAMPSDEGFLFAGYRSDSDYRQLISGHPLIRDRPEEREPLLRLDAVLDTLDRAGVHVPTPRTWRLPLDLPFPEDLAFPLFVRTAVSSWKRGGRFSRVESPKELEAEMATLRRALGWDALVLAREWVDLAPAGEGRYGPVPREVRVWAVDSVPVAWSFHYLNVLRNPRGFPPSDRDLKRLTNLAVQVASAFSFEARCDGFRFAEEGRLVLHRGGARKLCGN